MPTRHSPSQANLAQPLDDLLPFIRAWANARNLTTRAEHITAPDGGRLTMTALDHETDTLTVILGQDMKAQDLLPRLKTARTFADLVVMATIDEPTAARVKQCKALGVGIITPTTQPGAYYLAPRRFDSVKLGQREALWQRIEAVANRERPSQAPNGAELARAIDAYYAAHPTATVADLWRAIPNDYVNPRSFERNLRPQLTAARHKHRPQRTEASA